MIPRAAVLLSLLGAAACAPGAVEPTIDGPYVGLSVVGSVRTTDGAPVLGAELEIWARSPETCTGGFAGHRAISNSDGSFRGLLGAWNVPRDVCLWISVVPPEGSLAAGDTVTVQPARLDLSDSTIEVDIVLPPPAS